ncbi:MAG: SagB/ThcOx family dehydrogenase [Firmicutes bacterium]|jgi:SagB-type dehydrogenase family enzyme|nr:SagB/ThcOx family dehydrogenase [Bacillota bacterium]
MSRFPSERDTLKSKFPRMREEPTDQRLGLPQPSLQEAYAPDATLIDLPSPRVTAPRSVDLFDLIERRRSRREYLAEPITLAELSFLLWATQGVKRVVRDGFATMRTVPSGGSRHAFETYLAVNRVDGLEPGIYRYLALEHKLIHISSPPDLPAKLGKACFGQDFVGTAAVVFFWSCIPYRCEWRYSVAAHKTLAQDSGHVCQNLYIACEALGLGTVAIGSYHQETADALCGLGGTDEFVIYAAPVGRVSP